jgi:Putative zinc-finger
MNCRRAKKSLIEYVDGGLSKADREEVSRHLESCGDCSALAAKLKTSASAFSKLDPVTMPQQASRRVLGTLKSPGKAPRAVGFWHSPRALAAAGGVAAVLVALAVVVVVFAVGGPGTKPQQSESAVEKQAAGTAEDAQVLSTRTAPSAPTAALVLPVAKITRNNYNEDSAKTMAESLEVKKKFAERYTMSDAINLCVVFTKKLADEFTQLGGDGAMLEAMISFVQSTEPVLLPCYVEKAQYAGENVYIVGLSGPPFGGDTKNLVRTEFWAFNPDEFGADPEASLVWWGQSLKR